MAKNNGGNTRIKRAYFEYLREAKRHSTSSVDAAATAISRFEEATGHRDFKKFHRDAAMAFKRKLREQVNAQTGQPLSKSTINGTLRALREFFIWLAAQRGYKSKIQYCDADYFNLSEKEVAVARAKQHKAVPTLEQMHHVLSAMPHHTAVEMRNRALVAFAMLTGARDGAMASFKLKHVDLQQGMVHQDGRDVRTKFSKTFATWFFPVGGDALTIVRDWIGFLRSNLQWGDDDPLFPATQIGLGENGGFTVIGLQRYGWSSSAPIRQIFRDAFAGAGLPYFNPHSLRDMLVRLAMSLNLSAAQTKAWSQNLGHADVLTTFTSYGDLPAHQQGELIRGLGRRQPNHGHDPLDDADAAQLVAALAKRHGIGGLA